MKKFLLFYLAVMMLAALLFTFACGDDDDDDQAQNDDDAADDDQADDDQADDDQVDDDTADDDTFEQPPDDFACSDLGLPERDFDDAEPDTALYAVAADFTVNTTKGEWHFAEKWTGCETYLFIPDNSSQTTGWPDGLWDRDVRNLLKALPDNTHVFFVSYNSNPEQIEAALATVQEQADEYIDSLTEDEQARWWHRLHYVTDPATDMKSWLGDAIGSPRWGIGIDRFQRIRYIGSYADYGRYDASQQWFAPNLAMSANEADYYNFEAERDENLQAEDATVISLFAGEELSDPDWAGVRGQVEVVLPSATEMAQIDSMELDLYLGCVGDGEYGDCSPWDYLVYLYLCDQANPDECDTEIGRWITTYHREGRWVHDISAMLPLIADGGTRRFEFYTQQPYEVDLKIRLFDQDKPDRPEQVEYLFSGGAFGPDYNMSYAPIDVAIPANATKVELATVITGHGGVGVDNCAEFCNTTHHFRVNGYEYIRDFPEAGNWQDCMDKVTIGTVPNQYGTWWYGRSGWCPGLHVPMVMIDVTDQVTVGENATFEYEGLFNGEPFPEGGASIRMTSWAVISK